MESIDQVFVNEQVINAAMSFSNADYFLENFLKSFLLTQHPAASVAGFIYFKLINFYT